MSLLYSPFVAQWNLDCAMSPEYKVVASTSLGKDTVEGVRALKRVSLETVVANLYSHHLKYL